MLYFATIMVEIAVGPVLEAPSDEAAIRLMKSATSQEFGNVAGTIREHCIHRINGENASPIHSQNLGRDFKVDILNEVGDRIPYDLGNPSILRLAQQERVEPQNSDDIVEKLIISAQIKQQLDHQLNGDDVD